jgi:hypothetical protein
MEYTETAYKTIDITPTWSALLPTMLEVLKNPNAPLEAKQEITNELQRLAKFADNLNKQN